MIDKKNEHNEDMGLSLSGEEMDILDEVNAEMAAEANARKKERQMKTELRTKPHDVHKGQTIVELWHGGQLIGTVTGADGPGVRIITKHPAAASVTTDPPLLDGRTIRVVEVTIKPEGGG